MSRGDIILGTLESSLEKSRVNKGYFWTRVCDAQILFKIIQLRITVRRYRYYIGTVAFFSDYQFFGVVHIHNTYLRRYTPKELTLS